jgi:hypothetical protein
MNKNITSYPTGAWEDGMEAVVELPQFFAQPAWQSIDVLDPPGPVETASELEYLLSLQRNIEERERRRREIELEANSENPYFNRMLNFDAHPACYVLMQAMFELGTIVVVHFKKRYNRLRPSELEPRLRPMLDVPRHAAYPSGHSLQYHLVAKALASVVRSHEMGHELFEIARRVAENREWAGLHYPSDTAAGKAIAFAIFPQVTDAFVETFDAARREWL